VRAGRQAQQQHCRKLYRLQQQVPASHQLLLCQRHRSTPSSPCLV
jgi:hypothetical protein